MQTFKTIQAAFEELDYNQENVFHEIVYLIERKLTLDEWIELDNKMSAVFEEMNIETMGYAGPIPEIGVNNEQDNT